MSTFGRAAGRHGGSGGDGGGRGWAEVLNRLGDADRGMAPRLFIHQRCQRLVGTLPDLQHDPNRPEDVLKVDCDEQGAGGDDAADALRYLVASMPRRAGFMAA